MATCAVCGGNLADNSDSSESTEYEPDEQYTKLLKDIFKGVVKSGDISPEIISSMAKNYMEVVFEAYGKSLKSFVKFDGTDYRMLENLQRNVYAFSAAKNYQQIKSLTELIKDGDRVRSFSEFKREASNILEEFNKTWLETEYNTCIGGAQMASKWLQILQAEDYAPFLRYETVGDNRVREAHKELDNVIKRVSDPFWNTYYPPNGWNCRCTVIQMPGKSHTETPDKNIVLPDMPKMWQVNTAKENVIFPKGSPYFIGVPDTVTKQGENLLPFQHRFTSIFKAQNGGEVQVHNEYKPGDDDKKLKLIAKEKAKKGHFVKIMPEVHANEVELRKAIVPDAIGNKNADFRIDGVLTELKALKSSSHRAISDNIRKAASQANHVIIDIPTKIDEKTAKSILKRKMLDNKNLQVVEIRHNGEYKTYNRTDII